MYLSQHTLKVTYIYALCYICNIPIFQIKAKPKQWQALSEHSPLIGLPDMHLHKENFSKFTWTHFSLTKTFLKLKLNVSPSMKVAASSLGQILQERHPLHFFKNSSH